jgi:hypothetical protein
VTTILVTFAALSLFTFPAAGWLRDRIQGGPR